MPQHRRHSTKHPHDFRPQELNDTDRAVYVGGQLEVYMKLYEHESGTHTTFCLIHEEYEQLAGIRKSAEEMIKRVEEIASLYPDSAVVQAYTERITELYEKIMRTTDFIPDKPAGRKG